MSGTIPIHYDAQKGPNTLETFRLLADTIPTLCWMADASGEIYWYNKRWHEYTGLDSKRTTKKDWQSAHDPEDHAHIIEKWDKAVVDKKPFDMVVSLKGADGVFRPFLSHIVPSLDEQGNLNGWLGIKNDISDLRAADKALKESEDRFKILVEAMPQMAFMADAEGGITYYNQRWYDYINGLKGTEGWGWKDKPVHHPDDLKRAIETWNASVKSGKDYEIEYRLRRHDGQYRWHLGRAVAVRNEAGEITSWIGTNTDIQEQKRQSQNQDFLLEAASRLSETLDYKETLKTIANLCVPAIADWCSVDLLSGKGLFEQVAVAHVDKEKVAMAAEFRERNPVHAEEHATSGVSKVVQSGKTEFYPHIDNELLESSIDDPDTLRFMQSLGLHSIIIAPITMKNKPIGAITFVASESGNYYTKNDLSMVEDLVSRISLAISNATLYTQVQDELTHRQKLEKELTEEKTMLESRVQARTAELQRTNKGLESEIERRQQVEEELSRSNQELQDFAYVASHDLQEPLRKIQAFGDILDNEYGDKLGDGAEYVTRMHAAATRMSQLIEDLLVFSRVSTKAPDPARVSLNEVVSDVLIDLENRVKETKGRVELGTLPNVMADATHMRQLFQNLIANALKFHREGTPPVVIIKSASSKTTDNFVEITVADNGIGFDEKYADRIFGVFQRLHGRGSYEGTGIGLAVCRKIVERYGGTIEAKGKPGKGATFTINLPVAL